MVADLKKLEICKKQCYHLHTKGKRPLQSGCSYTRLDVLTDTASLVDQTGEALFFVLVPLIGKASNAFTHLISTDETIRNQWKEHAGCVPGTDW